MATLRISGGSSGADKFNDLIREARSQGWVVEVSRGAHVRFLPPDRTARPVYAASTPSDQRSWLNVRAKLRRAGLKI